MKDLWFSLFFLLGKISLQVRVVSSWSIGKAAFAGKRSLSVSTCLYLSSSPAAQGEDAADGIKVDAVAASGLSDQEVSIVLAAVENAFTEGVGIPVSCDESRLISKNSLCSSSSSSSSSSSPAVVGALGRVLLIQTNIEEDSMEVIQHAIAEQMDHLLYSDPPVLAQPVLISLQNSILNPTVVEETNVNQVLTSLVEQEVEQYRMIEPVSKSDKVTNDDKSYAPSLHVELDGAQVTDQASSLTWWDTSSVLVFDDLVDDNLRRRLLDVTLGRKDEDDMDDLVDGPNPKRWVRGGLFDIPDEEDEPRDEEDEAGPCWGLRFEAVEAICFQRHAAIEEFESILSSLFPQFVVMRLPEAVFGASVSPLTANAPTAGDTFNYHIDGDPNLTPPSPWTDVYGRYPNRMSGKPRFVSCLLYLNEEWHEDWGAPTRFLDPPTDQAYDILPKPGRCVLMDQDVSHTVVAPNPSAGKRPRYSLVWKLILHPKREGQDMSYSAMEQNWLDPVLFGSAKEGQ